MKQIFNGGLELGIFEIVGEENLTEADKKRKAYLESLPKNKWILLDETGQALSEHEARQQANKELSKFKIKESRIHNFKTDEKTNVSKSQRNNGCHNSTAGN